MNLPNKLSLSRIFLIPVFLVVLSLKVPYGDYIAAGVFILAACTDGLDGYIARKKGLITRLGKLLDPLADKLLISAALIALVELGRLSGWVAVVIIGREFAVTGLRSIMVGENVVIAASQLGKIKTISQVIAIVVMFIGDYSLSFINIFGDISSNIFSNISLGSIAMTIAVIFTIWSGVDYFQKAWASLNKDEI